MSTEKERRYEKTEPRRALLPCAEDPVVLSTLTKCPSARPGLDIAGNNPRDESTHSTILTGRRQCGPSWCSRSPSPSPPGHRRPTTAQRWRKGLSWPEVNCCHNLEYDSSEEKNPRLIFYDDKDEVVKTVPVKELTADEISGLLDSLGFYMRSQKGEEVPEEFQHFPLRAPRDEL